jgi:hypothetical protein
MTPPEPRRSGSLADRPFWLDGGYDRDSVEACRYHPKHEWWIFRLGDVIKTENLRDPDEMMVICRACYVPRCGYTTEPDPCILPRHHPELHLTASGVVENPREWPGSTKRLPPDIA